MVLIKLFAGSKGYTDLRTQCGGGRKERAVSAEESNMETHITIFKTNSQCNGLTQ